MLEAALAANADVIVTGDADLLDLSQVGDVPVVTRCEFLDEFVQGQ